MKDKINYSEFVVLCRGREKIELTEKEKVRESRKIFEEILRTNRKTAYYGVNTGIGAFLNKHIPKSKMKEFQENLIMSHACGVGLPLGKEIVRGIMLHMILNLKKGYSGIRLETLELLIEMFNREIIPVVPEKGSLGASGDLVPQAHIALALIGKDSGQVLRAGGLPPAKLDAGEAIALLNGTSLMTSYLAFLVFQADNLIAAADAAAAMTIEALGCNLESFEDELQRLRPHLGQIVTANRLSNLLKKSSLLTQKRQRMVQDAYSLRCVPQVHGAFREILYKARDVVDTEINSFCGNPLISTKGEKPEILQGSGNFHGQILAQTADSLAIALTGLSGISERRIERLLNSKLSGLPPFLAKKGGLDSGLMIAQYTGAALVSENKTLAHPASVDSIPVSASQEDFVSMGAWAVRKAWEICRNTEYVIAIEILGALRALDFQKGVPLAGDKILSNDIEKLYELLHAGKLLEELGYEKND